MNILAPLSGSVPPSSEMSAIELYSLTCLVFNGAALLEFGLVIYKKSQLHKIQQKLINNKIMGRLGIEMRREGKHYEERETRSMGRKPFSESKKICHWMSKGLDPKVIDVCSSCIFPTLFIVFNGLYWSMYLSKKEEKKTIIS